MTDGVTMKGRQTRNHNKSLDQLHNNCMSLEKIRLQTENSLYWLNMNADIKEAVKSCSTCVEFQQMHPKNKITPLEIPGKLWEE